MLNLLNLNYLRICSQVAGLGARTAQQLGRSGGLCPVHQEYYSEVQYNTEEYWAAER